MTQLADQCMSAVFCKPANQPPSHTLQKKGKNVLRGEKNANNQQQRTSFLLEGHVGVNYVGVGQILLPCQPTVRATHPGTFPPSLFSFFFRSAHLHVCSQAHRLTPDFPESLYELLCNLQEGRRLNDQRCSFSLDTAAAGVRRRRCHSEPNTTKPANRGEWQWSCHSLDVAALTHLRLADLNGIPISSPSRLLLHDLAADGGVLWVGGHCSGPSARRSEGTALLAAQIQDQEPQGQHQATDLSQKARTGSCSGSQTCPRAQRGSVQHDPHHTGKPLLNSRCTYYKKRKPNNELITLHTSHPQAQGRLEDQRSRAPGPMDDEDFFSLLLKVQGGRMEEQRTELPCLLQTWDTEIMMTLTPLWAVSVWIYLRFLSLLVSERTCPSSFHSVGQC